MTPDPDKTRLLALALAFAPLTPSAEAARLAAMEWRAARRAWLQAIEALGFTEDQARGCAQAVRDAALKDLLAEEAARGSG